MDGRTPSGGCGTGHDMDIYSFGTFVRRRRKALDMTQRELAEAVGCALVTLKKIETDQRRPSPEMAARLAECLAIPEAEMAPFLAAARGLLAVDSLARQPPPALLPPRDVVPLAATPLIGREVDIATVLALLGSPDARLVSLVGPGGIGKTRLALGAAAALQQVRPRPFASGIVFVDLAAVSDVAGMADAVATAMGFEPNTRSHAPRSVFDQMAEFLRRRDILLILDNLEQLDGARRVIDDLLRATSSLKVLATSRERLDLPWEHLLALRGLAYPSETAADPATFPAGQLFLNRARRLRPDFVPGLADRRALTGLCALVDGLPLALELAAAWIDTLSLAEIAAELRHDLSLPGETRDDRPERHRSLGAVWDGAWARLAEAERAAFAQLCVFRGGFTRSAAEAVAGVTLGLLGRLTAKYLITFDPGAGRYRIHELLRQYGYANLETLGTADDAHQRHFDYFLAYIESLAPRVRSWEQAEALGRIAADSDNVAAALEWGLARAERVDSVVRLLSALHWYWRIRSRVLEASTWIERALAVLGLTPVGTGMKPAQTPAAAQLLFESGHFAWMRGEFFLARDRQAAALAIWEALGRGDGHEAAVTRQHLAMALSYLDDPWAAAPLAEAALVRFRELGQTWWVTFILPQVAKIRLTLGDRAGSDAAAAEHLQLVDNLGFPWLTGLGRLNLGELAWQQGDHDRARRLIEEGLAAQRLVGHTHSVGSALMMLGEIAVEQGDRRAAAGHFAEALALYEAIGHTHFAAEASEKLRLIASGK